MNSFLPFKIDYWWQVLLIIGALFCASSVIFNVPFLEEKNLFGLGLGCLLIGLSYWKSKKVIHEFYERGILYYDKIEFDIWAKILFTIGCLISILFAVLLIIDLI